MGKKDKEEEFVMVAEAQEIPVAKAPEPRPVVVAVRPPTKAYSFEQWAKLRNKPNRHLNGMKAFLGGEAGFKYTLDVWDAKMASY